MLCAAKYSEIAQVESEVISSTKRPSRKPTRISFKVSPSITTRCAAGASGGDGRRYLERDSRGLPRGTFCRRYDFTFDLRYLRVFCGAEHYAPRRSAGRSGTGGLRLDH